jgi:hypothetical protein
MSVELTSPSVLDVVGVDLCLSCSLLLEVTVQSVTTTAKGVEDRTDIIQGWIRSRLVLAVQMDIFLLMDKAKKFVKMYTCVFQCEQNLPWKTKKDIFIQSFSRRRVLAVPMYTFMIIENVENVCSDVNKCGQMGTFVYQCEQNVFECVKKTVIVASI